MPEAPLDPPPPLTAFAENETSQTLRKRRDPNMLQRGNMMLLMCCVLLLICLVAIARLNSAKADLQAANEQLRDELQAAGVRRPPAEARVTPAPEPQPSAERPGREEPPASAQPPPTKAPRRPAATVPGLPGGRPPWAPEGTKPPLDLSPEAREFFQAHKPLLERARRIMLAASAHERQGRDVGEVASLFRQASRAAAAGDAQRVEKLLTRAEETLGLPPPRQLERLARGVREFEKALDRAAAEGKNVRALAPLFGQIREALKAGDVNRAQALLDRGMDRLAKMKPERAHRRTSARQQPAPSIAPILALVMEREVKNLRAIDESLENARLVLRSGTPEQAEQIVDRAISQLNEIRKRRRALAQAARLASRSLREGKGETPPTPPIETGPPGVPLSFDVDEARRQVLAAFDRVRSLPQQRYEEEKVGLFEALLQRLFPTPPAGEHMTPEQAKTEAEARERLRLAAGPYAEKRAAGEDVAQVEAKIERARKYLAEGEYELANELAAEALEALGVQLPGEPAAK